MTTYPPSSPAMALTEYLRYDVHSHSGGSTSMPTERTPVSPSVAAGPGTVPQISASYSTTTHTRTPTGEKRQGHSLSVCVSMFVEPNLNRRFTCCCIVERDPDRQTDGAGMFPAIYACGISRLTTRVEGRRKKAELEQGVRGGNGTMAGAVCSAATLPCDATGFWRFSVAWPPP